ncbi:MAG TPA: cysteine-rich CWC family protein [Kofleriaceae bacterium]
MDPIRCPLCGDANECQLAAGRSTCWCFYTPAPAHVLARVPAEAQGIACVCRRCFKPAARAAQSRE